MWPRSRPSPSSTWGGRIGYLAERRVCEIGACIDVLEERAIHTGADSSAFFFPYSSERQLEEILYGPGLRSSDGDCPNMRNLKRQISGRATRMMCPALTWIVLAKPTLSSKVSVPRLRHSGRRQRWGAARHVGRPRTPPSGSFLEPLSVPKCTRKDSRRRAHWFLGATLYGPVRGQSGSDLPAASMLLKRRSACSQTARDKGTVWETGAARRTR